MFKKFLDAFRQNENKTILGIIGIATVSSLAYLIYRNFTRNYAKDYTETPSEISFIQNEEDKIKQFKQGQYRLKLRNIVENIKKQFQGREEFIFSTVKAIYEGYHELSGNQFRKITRKSREKRRKVMEILPKYLQIINKCQKEIQQAKTRSLVAILQYFKIDLMYWFMLANKYKQQAAEQWNQMSILVDVMQLSSLQQPPKKPIQASILLEIFLYKQKIFQQVLNVTSQYFKDRKSGDTITFIDRRIGDLVYFRFGCQDQDIFLSMITMDKKTKHQVQQIQKRLHQYLQKFIQNQNKNNK